MTVLEFSKNFDALRIIPRLIVISCIIFFGFYVIDVTQWYMDLAVRGVEESGFAASVITLLGGVVKFMVDKLIDTEAKND